jgi:tetratricopeptide (TPR) repeat protein
VFAGGCTLEAAEAVCNGKGVGLTPLEIATLDGVASLVDKSLLQHQQGGNGEPRFAMLETIRDFGLEGLVESGEEAAIRRQHAQFFLELAETAERYLRGPEGLKWRQRLEAESGNLQAALAWCAATPERGDHLLRLVGALAYWWEDRGSWSEGRGWLEAALARGEATERTAARAKALFGLSDLAWWLGDRKTSFSSVEEALEIQREVRDKRGLARSLNALAWGRLNEEVEPASIRMLEGEDWWCLVSSLLCLGLLARREGALDEAQIRFQEALAISRDYGDQSGVAWCLGHMAELALLRGSDREARALAEESLAIHRQCGGTTDLSFSLGVLCRVATHQSDYGMARALAEERLAIYREMGEKVPTARLLIDLGVVARMQGDYPGAQVHFEESLTIFRELGDQRGHASALTGLGYVTFLQGDLDTAQALLEKSLSLQRELPDRPGMGWTLAHLIEVADRRGEYQASLAHLEESLTIWRELGVRYAIAWSLHKGTSVLLHQGDVKRAAAMGHEGLALRREVGDKRGIAECMESLAGVAAAEQEPERAVRLLGAAMALREAIGSPIPPVERAEHERLVTTTRGTLGEEAFTAAWAQGWAMSLEDAVAGALQKMETGG